MEIMSYRMFMQRKTNEKPLHSVANEQQTDMSDSMLLNS